MIYSPFLYLVELKASAIYILSYGSISANNSTCFKKFSYLSLFFDAASFTIALKVALSNENKIASVLAVIFAALGALYKSANSPKDSPGLYVFK